MLLSCALVSEMSRFGRHLSFVNEVSYVLNSLCEHDHDCFHLDNMEVGLSTSFALFVVVK